MALNPGGVNLPLQLQTWVILEFFGNSFVANAFCPEGVK